MKKIKLPDRKYWSKYLSDISGLLTFYSSDSWTEDGFRSSICSYLNNMKKEDERLKKIGLEGFDPPEVLNYMNLHIVEIK